jgi:leucyl-tRNA synthetase
VTIPVFTTRPDLIYGVSYLFLAPENPLVADLTTSEYAQEVKTYQEAAKTQTDVERKDESRPKTGVFTGSYVAHPLSGEPIPV